MGGEELFQLRIMRAGEQRGLDLSRINLGSWKLPPVWSGQFWDNGSVGAVRQKNGAGFSKEHPQGMKWITGVSPAGAWTYCSGSPFLSTATSCVKSI